MELSSETTVEAPAELVWEIVAHRFDRIGDWATAIPASRACGATSGSDGPVEGRVCETGLRMFPSVVETIVEYDDASRTLTYVGEGLPAFVAAARNRWQVTAIDHRRARVGVEATVETRGVLGRC